MKNILLVKKCLTAFLLLMAITSLNAQTTFWQDNFDLPASCVNNAGQNWTLGGTDDGILCSNSWAIGTAAGTCGTSGTLYITASGLFCDGDKNEYLSDNTSDLTAYSPTISTVGITGITLSFNWRNDGFTAGSGSAGSDAGQVGLYDGTTWTWLPTQYWKMKTCTTAVVTVPNTYEGKANFKIGFRFQAHASGCSACDPPFNIDDITLSGTGNIANTPPAAPTVPQSTISVCPGEALNLAASTTETGITWEWTGPNGFNNAQQNPNVTNSAQNIHQGVYTVKIKKGNCTSAGTNVTVTVGTGGGSGAATSNSPVCTGGTLNLDVPTTGTGYTWSGPNSFTASTKSPTRNITSNADAGTYSVTVSGGGCAGTYTVSVAVNIAPTAPSLNVSPVGVDTICGGDSVTICVNGTFNAYHWNNTPATTTNCVVVRTAGDYFLTVTDNNTCTALSQFTTIEKYPDQSVSIGRNTNIVSTTNVSTYYQWYRNDTLIPGANQQSYTANRVGDYSVTIKDQYGCFLTSSKIGIGTAIDEVETIHFEIYPNPASGNITIQYDGTNGKNIQLNLYTVVGARVKSEILNFSSGKNIPVDVSSLPKGVYMLELQQSGKRPYTQKLILQ